jgi:hypothetical protein
MFLAYSAAGMQNRPVDINHPDQHYTITKEKVDINHPDQHYTITWLISTFSLVMV